MVTSDSETWKVLFGHALSLIDDVLLHCTKNLYWTFGGGTAVDVLKQRMEAFGKHKPNSQASRN